MSDELELQDSEEPDQDLDLEENETQEEEVDWEAKAKELESKNKQLYSRLKKPEKKPDKSSTDDFSDIRETVQKLSLSEQKRQFGYENNLSPEETDAVFRINPEPDEKTLEDPFVKGGLEAIRAKKRIEGATPSSSNKATTVKGKAWSQMNADERKANFDDIMSKVKKVE